MQPNFISYNIQYIYVTGREQQLIGVLKVRDLLLSDVNTLLGNLITEQPDRICH